MSYLTLYILVISYSFTPNVVGFGTNNYYTFDSLEKVAHKVYEIRKIQNENFPMKLFKVELFAENEWHEHYFETHHNESIAEIEIPTLEMNKGKP